MRHLATTIVGAGLVATALASPVVAGPAPVTIWITLYYDVPTDGPRLPQKVVTYPFQVRDADAAQALCGSRSSLDKVAAFVRGRHLELQNTLDGETGKCVTDKSGAIKMTAGLPVGGN